MSSLKRNVASQNITFQMISTSTNLGVTGLASSITVFITKDNGVQASGLGTFTEAGHGQYVYSPTQTETSATNIGFMFSSTNCVIVNMNFYTILTDANGLPQVGLQAVNGSTIAANALAQSTQTINWGTVQSSTGTAVTVSSLNNPATLSVPGQLIGRSIVFLGTTSTAAAQCEASQIIGSSLGATPIISFSPPLAAAPTLGDVFVIV